MQTLLLLDVRRRQLELGQWLGSPFAELAIDAAQVCAVIGHVADTLEYLDRLDGSVRLVVLSDDPPPRRPNELNHWGYGKRCGQSLGEAWLSVAVKEGRIADVTWLHFCDPAPVVTNSESDPRDFGAANFLDLLRAGAAIIVCTNSDGPIARLRDAERAPTDGTSYWHGSSSEGLQQLTPSPRRLWLSPSKSFAACFAASPYSNLGFYQGVDHSGEAGPTIYLAVPPGHEHVLDAPCSLYEVRLSPAELREVGIPNYEYVLHRPAATSRETRYRCCREALAELGVEIIEISRASVVDQEMMDRCEPFRYAIEAFVCIPFDIATRIPSKRWAFQYWLWARGLEHIEPSEASVLQRILERIWLPAVAANSKLAERGYHSLLHCMQVALLAALIAWEERSNPIPAALAGLLHDAARHGDEEGSEHAASAVAFIDQAMGRELRHLLSPGDFRCVRMAVAGHAEGKRSSEPIASACWDADRLRLAWERGVSPQFFSTASGLSLAHAGAAHAYTKARQLFGRRYFS